jgi:hypothetical protein
MNSMLDVRNRGLEFARLVTSMPLESGHFDPRHRWGSGHRGEREQSNHEGEQKG